MGDQSTTTNKKPSWIRRLYSFVSHGDAVTLVKMSVPLAISYILSLSTITTVSLVFMGHLGQAELNASSLANTVYVLICYGLMAGINFGCDTLLPQYYRGNKKKMGIILQRGTIIAGYVCFISWILMLNAKYVLRWIEHDEHIVTLTDIYLKYFVAIPPLCALSLLLRIYVASTSKVIPIVIVHIIGNIINLLSHYICVHQLNMGIRAAPVSISIAYATIVLCYVVYIRFSSLYTDTWHPVTRACLQDWNIYLQYGLPGIVVMMVELWSIETSTFFGAHLNNRSLSAQAVAQQVVFTAYLIMTAVGDAGNILIGRSTGANKPTEAIHSKNVIYIVTAIFAIFNMSVIVITHRWLPLMFSVEKAAIPLTRNVLLLAAAFSLFDACHIVQTGMAKSCGLQKYTAIVWIIGFFVVGLPLAYILTFIVHMDIYGFWIGMISAEIVTNGVLSVILWRFDWYSYTKVVQDRTVDKSLESLSQDSPSLLVSASNLSNNEQLQFLTHEDNTTSLQLDERQHDVSATKTDKSLFTLIGVKLIVLFPLICLFAISIIISFW